MLSPKLTHFLLFLITFLVFIFATIHILNNETFVESLYHVKESGIHGKGAFASVKLNKDSDLGIIVVRGENNIRFFRRYNTDRFFKDKDQKVFKEHRSLGRYLNHSETPNCEIVINNNTCSLRTINEVQEGEELTTNYKPFRDAYLGGYMIDVQT